MLSTTLQPEFSAVLVGRKSPERAMRDATAQIQHLLRSVEPVASTPAAGPPVAGTRVQTMPVVETRVQRTPR